MPEVLTESTVRFECSAIQVQKIPRNDKALPVCPGTLSGTQRVIPSGRYSAILAAQVADQSAGFGSSYPLTELA